MASHAHIPGCARLNVMRLNAARLNYAEPVPFVNIGGVDRSKQVRIEGATVDHLLNDAPDTAQLRVHGFTPVAGQPLQVYVSDRSLGFQIFGGNVLETTVLYESRKDNIAFDLHGIDLTWLLNRRRVLESYAGQSATTIILNLMAKYSIGMTTNNVAAGLPVIDAITFTNDLLATCLTAICERIGGNWYLDYGYDLHVFLTEGPDAQPITDANPRGASDLSLTEDVSQIVTRVIARGGAGKAFVDVAAGATEIPVTDDGWFSASSGGLAEAAQQRITYTGKRGTGGTGAIVGTPSTPTSPPTLVPWSAAGALTAGTYQYAQTMTTASGETLPGPSASVTVGGASVPALKPTTARSTGSASWPTGMTPGGSYSWKVAVLYGDGSVVIGPATPTYVVDGNAWEIYFGVPIQDPSTGNYYNPGLQLAGYAPILATNVYRTTNGGGAWYAEIGWSGAVPTSTGWMSVANNISDAALVGRTPYPAGPAPTFTSVSVRNLQQPAGGITGSKLYRTIVNGSQLKLLATNPPAGDYIDTAADAALGANVPTTDTAGVPASNLQVPVGAPELPVTSIAPFVADGGAGWAQVGNIPIRYTGTAAGKLTGIPTSGEGSITATVRYGAQVLVIARLVGVTGLVRALKAGDPITVRVEVEDVAAQNAFMTRIGATNPLQGVVEEPYSDSRMTITELTQYARALLDDRKDPRRTLRFKTRDLSVQVGRLITVTTTKPPISGTFRVQRVGFSEIAISGGLARTQPLKTVEASDRLFTFADLLRRLRGREGGAQ